jgi:hypothetical protein
MKYSQDHDSVFLCAKVNAIWKTIGDNASNVLFNDNKLQRIDRGQRYAAVNFGNELKPET